MPCVSCPLCLQSPLWLVITQAPFSLSPPQPETFHLLVAKSVSSRPSCAISRLRTPGQLIHFSEPQFLHQQKRKRISASLPGTSKKGPRDPVLVSAYSEDPVR